MKFTLSWLKSHLDTDASADEIALRLTELGLELESLEDPAPALAGFIVGHVLEADKHPNADRLKLCKVDIGARQLQIVCGAPNARAGLKVVLALPGVVIPISGEILKAGQVRGVESHGMMCSWRELKLGEDHDGIIELPEQSPVGARLIDVLPMDPLFDISVTPNRADCLSVRGVARDLAASGLGSLKPLTIPAIARSGAEPRKVRLEPCGSPFFAGRVISGIKNGESPDWLKKRLTSIGLKPISVLVDITNFFTFDLGRPLHVFDDSTLAGELVVRPAREGESLVALNGKTLTLDPAMTVIADDRSVQSIGGVMGGMATGVSPATTSVFLEAALFAPSSIAATGRVLALESDARYRFERGVDPDFVLPALDLATQMILDLCGGVASAPVVAGQLPQAKPLASFRPARVLQLSGVTIPPDAMKQSLIALGCHVDDSAPVWQVGLPSWRVDLNFEHDLVEEVLRLNGFDAIPAVSMSRPAIQRPALTPAQRRITWLRRCLAARGMAEAVTWSFLPEARARLFGGGQAELMVANPISRDLNCLRPSLLPNLLAALARNQDRGFKDVALFEIGPQFKGDQPADQQAMAAGLRAGQSVPRNWSGSTRPVDLFDVKADALAAIAAAGGPVESLQVTKGAPSWYHPGRSGSLTLGNRPLGWFGEIHPAILAEFGLDLPTMGFELALDVMPALKPKPSKARPAFRPPALQAIERDFAFVVDSDVAADLVVRAARNADKAMISAVSLFDLYEGSHVGAGKKSLAIQVTLQPTEKSLTDAEIEAIAGKIIEAVIKASGGVLRA